MENQTFDEILEAARWYLLTKYLYFFVSTSKRVYLENILKQRKRWNKLEPPVTRKNELKSPETSWGKMELVKNGTWKSNGSWLQRSFGCKRFFTRFFKKNIYLLDFVKDQRTEVVLYKERSTTSFAVFFLYQMSYKYFCVNFPSAPSYIKRRIYVKLTNTIHSAHIDFRENNTSWRVIVPSGFLINKVILKCSPLNMINHKNALLFVS